MKNDPASRYSVNFGSGRYVMAGVKNSDTDAVFATSTGVNIQGGTAEGSDPGRLFILTDGSYGGQLDAVRAGITNMSKTSHVLTDQTAPVTAPPTLGYGYTDIQSGNDPKSSMELYGLDRQQVAAISDELKEFAPLLIWQDKNNSNAEGRYWNGRSDPGALGAQRLSMWANSRTKWGGLIYQPRGAWVIVHGGKAGEKDRYEGALRIISGAMEVSGSADVTLTTPSTPTTYTTAALIE